jgi:hypothetical protein
VSGLFRWIRSPQPFVLFTILVAALVSVALSALRPPVEAQAALFRPPFTLKASRIEATNAHLSLDPKNLLNNTLSFSSATIQGMSITRSSGGKTLTITASGTVISGTTTIKTSVLNDLSTLGSFQNPGDAVTLVLGGTVRDLVLKNVTLNIDNSMQTKSLTMPGMQLTYR